MFIIGNLFIALANIAKILLFFARWVLVARALISWVSPDPFNPIVKFLHRVTEPILSPIRRFMPSSGIDFSVLIAILLVFFLEQFFVGSLLGIGLRLQ